MQEMIEIEKVFPGWRQYPGNSMTPGMAGEGNNATVFFLVKCDEEIVQDFRKEPPGSKVLINTLTYWEKSQYGEGRDLVIRFDFYFDTGQPQLETVLYHDVDCSALAQALLQVTNVHIIVITTAGEYVKTKLVSWRPEKHRGSLKLLL